MARGGRAVVASAATTPSRGEAVGSIASRFEVGPKMGSLEALLAKDQKSGAKGVQSGGRKPAGAPPPKKLW